MKESIFLRHLLLPIELCAECRSGKSHGCDFLPNKQVVPIMQIPNSRRDEGISERRKAEATYVYLGIYSQSQSGDTVRSLRDCETGAELHFQLFSWMIIRGRFLSPCPTSPSSLPFLKQGVSY